MLGDTLNLQAKKDYLKEEIDRLDEEQLQKIQDLITQLKTQPHPSAREVPFWQHATPPERAQDLQKWTSQLPQNSPSLPDEAFDRSTIYD
ncbi:MAG: hypothetical protein AB4040_00330 [Synechococcus sp.]